MRAIAVTSGIQEIGTRPQGCSSKPLGHRLPWLIFSCWEFNVDADTVLWSATTGYAGSMASVFKFRLLPVRPTPVLSKFCRAQIHLKTEPEYNRPLPSRGLWRTRPFTEKFRSPLRASTVSLPSLTWTLSTTTWRTLTPTTTSLDTITHLRWWSCCTLMRSIMLPTIRGVSFFQVEFFLSVKRMLVFPLHLTAWASNRSRSITRTPFSISGETLRKWNAV